MTKNVDLKNETPTFGNVLLPAGAVGLRVLSLFDGMSCGQQALERIGVNVLEYYASEIDKHAIAVTMHNYPNTKQLGSVVDVDGYKLPKIDLLIGGSPCQSFSFAGKRKGMSTKCETEILTLEHYLELKNEGYEFEGQSYLFWEYMRLLNEVKPKYFLLENVMMGEKWEKILSKAIGVKPIEINSALVSAQNRRRLYWTNIGMQPMGLFGDLESIIPQPKDKGILLKDILESEVDAKYFISEKMIDRIKRSNNGEKCFADNQKSMCLAAGYFKQGRDNQLVTVHNTMPRSSKTGKGGIDPLSRNDGKTYCLDTGQTNVIEVLGGDFRHDEGFRWRENGKSGTLSTKGATENSLSGIPLSKIQGNIRRLTPKECERLQTVKDGYTSVASDSQRYRMLGNGWTVDVIAHILSYGEWS
jgi:DNA (cytosine-5)-methyltransferase 1